MQYRIERLAKQERASFDCGSEELNRYLHQMAGQDERKRYAACFVAVELASEHVAGYYTLSAASIDLTRIPEEIAKRLPRYPVVPVVKIGRLAVDQKFQEMGLARLMLADAYIRVRDSQIGCFALAVDAIDAEAEKFYIHHGFFSLQAQEANKPILFLPIRNEKV